MLCTPVVSYLMIPPLNYYLKITQPENFLSEQFNGTDIIVLHVHVYTLDGFTVSIINIVSIFPYR